MCGFVGIVTTARDLGSDPRHARDAHLVHIMNQTIVHRGPDDVGYHFEPGVSLGHRRLSILDLEGGRQPMFNEDGSVCVVYNGEIYNYRELASELAAAGHTFKSRSDTEVIVHAWEEWGESCLERFRGMFAFALWDATKRKLFLARDRLGIKPLYYSVLPDGSVVFGSELKALLPHPELRRDFDLEAIEDYFAYGFIPDPKTIYRGVYKLPPAHYLLIERGRPIEQPRAYWDLSFHSDRSVDSSRASEELLELLEEAVELRMLADVPLGAFLSGGVDSSSVTAMMARLSPDPIRTFSIGFNNQSFDETAYSKQVSTICGTRHLDRYVTENLYTLIGQIANAYDEPFADSSAMPTYQLCALAREQVTVVLSGDGGDEVLAGYHRYRWHKLAETVRALIPGGVRRPLLGRLGRALPHADWGPKFQQVKATLEDIGRDSAAGYFHYMSLNSDGTRQRLYSDSLLDALDGYHAIQLIERYLDRAPGGNHVDKIQYLDLKTYLPGDILTKVDRASMAHSLEVRVPFLDHKLVEWAARLPTRLRLNRNVGKYVLKKAMERYLPRSILYREKMGFAVPLAHWLRHPLKDISRDTLNSEALRSTGLFDQKAVNTLLDEHQAGAQDHSATIWAAIMFEAFLRQGHASMAATPDPAPAENAATKS